jgi:hypothetical protein
MACKLWLFLVLEKGVMKNLIVNINLSHFRLHAFSHLLFQSLVFVAGLLTDFCNSCLFNEVRQLKWCLVHSSLVLEVSSLLTPVTRDRNRVSHHLHVH